MLAIDTNILVYALREECSENKCAQKILRELSESLEPWAIPWPCLYEFFRVVTHPKIFDPPTPMSVATSNLRKLLKSPSLVLLRETENHFEILEMVLEETKITGNLVFDAHICALMRENGVSKILTADTDFNKFSNIKVENPF